jgi:hypothetical protein
MQSLLVLLQGCGIALAWVGLFVVMGVFFFCVFVQIFFGLLGFNVAPLRLLIALFAT